MRTMRRAAPWMTGIMLLTMTLSGPALVQAHHDGSAPPTVRTVAVPPLPMAVAVAPHLGRIYVASQGLLSSTGIPRGPGTLTVLDTATGSVVHTVRVGIVPSGVGVDERTGHVFVANAGTPSSGPPTGPGTVSMVDARTGVVLRTITTDTAPRAVAVDETSGHAFVLTAHGVALLSTRTGDVARMVTLGKTPYTVLSMAVGARLGQVLVTLPQSNSVVVLDTRTGALLRTLHVGKFPSAVAVDQRTGRAFVAGASSVSVLDLRTGALVRSVALGSLGWRVVVDEARGHVFVSDTFVSAPTAKVYMLDARTGALLQATTIGGDPGEMALEGTAGRLFVATPREGKHDAVKVLDAGTGLLLGTAHTGTGPWAVAADETTAHVFITCIGYSTTGAPPATGAVTILDGAMAFAPAATGASGQAHRAWAVTGALHTARASHTATLLSDGRVLIAGGTTCCDANGRSFTLTSAELYDPRTGRWAGTGAMTNPRTGHAALLLSGGQVLVVGGMTCCDAPDRLRPAAGAELYDAQSGRWQPTGALHTARGDATATLLRDGRVLVAGGVTGCSPGRCAVVATAEVYDPHAGRWQATGSMSTARAGHVAALLPDGQVLVAEGYGSGSTTVATAELYNPTTGSWQPTGALPVALTNHPVATALADGRVLVTGGCGPTDCPDTTAELYDPRTGTWRRTGSLREARWTPAATLLSDGRVIVAGGETNANVAPVVASAEVYDPRTARWTSAGTMAEARHGATATVLPDARIVVVGGISSGGQPLASAEMYKPETAPVARP